MLNPISPARTPSKSSNVERLMSLQKSSRHISDADILSFAAEASAIKRMAKTTADENTNPNSRSVSKRLFDISQCTKSVMGSYSPEAPAATTEQQQQQNAADESDGSDSETDEVDTEQQTGKHVEQILQLVQHSASKAMRKREAKRAAARQNTVSVPAATGAAANRATANTSNSHSISNDYGNNTVHSEPDGFDDAFCGSAAEMDTGSDVHMQDSTTHTAVTSTTSSGAVAAPVVATAGDIRDMVIAHILGILNHGSYDEILSLRGIGQVRALRIQTARNAGHTFASLQDLEEVGMNDWTIAKFLKSNAAHIVS